LVTSSAATFASFNLIPKLAAAVAALGINTPTPIQMAVIPALLAGKDVIGQARTGSGKTIAFALPVSARCEPSLPAVQALALTPTRELAIQVGQVFETLARPLGLRVTLLYGGRSLDSERRALRTGAQIVVGTPGRTLDHLRQGSLSLSRLHLLVLDEADEMLDRGFGPDVERIISHTPARRQTALFSATVPEWVGRTASKYLHNPIVAQVDSEISAPPEIEHVVYAVDPTQRFGALRTLLDRQGPNPIIVFGRTKHGVKKLARQLSELGYSIAALQGNMSQNARERVVNDFRSGAVRVLAATNVAARGLDIEGVEQVINYELADSPALFTHRAGRTGRMGRAGSAVTLLTPEDAPKWREIERSLGRIVPQPWIGDTYPPTVQSTAPQPQRSAGAARGLSPARVRRQPSVAPPARSESHAWQSGPSARPTNRPQSQSLGASSRPRRR
jgi:ATP-dependent RNA helicase DeaD